MLSWIPIIGPIIQGISSIWNGWFQEKVQLKQAEVSEVTSTAQTSADIIHYTNDDIGLRLIRDITILPVTVWSGMIGWDSIFAKTHPEWMFHPVPYPPSLDFMPYAVMVFLFGNIGLNMWRGK